MLTHPRCINCHTLSPTFLTSTNYRFPRQADDRHPRLEQPENQADTPPGPGVDAADPDPDGRREVRQAQRQRDQQNGEHMLTL